eukprot:m51a1_g3337 putative mrna turnover protein 4 homolog (269) ;mRNA; r:390334-391528
MPKSRRPKIVSLTNTKKAGYGRKNKLVEGIRQCVNDYSHVVVFETCNMRNTFLKDVRKQWETSRFFFGRNRVMQVALGRSEQEECAPGMAQVSRHLTGTCGLCFTNNSKDEVLEFFRSFHAADYARSGFKATETVVIPKGPLPQFDHSMEAYLRTKLQVPTELALGVIKLTRDFTVCTEGDVLTPEQARILKLFERKMADFHFEVKCIWTRDGGKFEQFSEPSEEKPEKPEKPAAPKKGKKKQAEEEDEEEEEEEEDEDEDDEEMADN